MRRLFLATLFICATATVASAEHWAMGGSMWANRPASTSAKKVYKPVWSTNKTTSSSWKKKKTNSSWKKKKKKSSFAKGKNKKGAKKWVGGAKPYIKAVKPPVVSFRSKYGKGSIVIDTKGRKLYYVLSRTKAYRYPIAVGRKGFTWSGTHKISKKVNWPSWRPPAEMRKRSPGLPKVMTGGVNNPLGAKALYLGSTLYRIHGTNKVSSVGRAVSSGCFRMRNGHVAHLAKIARVGTKVRVLKRLPKKVRTASK